MKRIQKPTEKQHPEKAEVSIAITFPPHRYIHARRLIHCLFPKRVCKSRTSEPEAEFPRHQEIRLRIEEESERGWTYEKRVNADASSS